MRRRGLKHAWGPELNTLKKNMAVSRRGTRNKKSQKSRNLIESRNFAKHYYDPSMVGSFSGFSTFKKNIKPSKTSSLSRTRARAEKWLNTQDAYLLHKPFISKFKRRKVIANLNEYWQTDLIDVSAYSSQNGGVKFILTCIDVFSKKAFARPILKKSAKSVTEAFRGILETSGTKPRYLNSDQGKEYLNSTFQNLLKEYSVKFFSTKDSDVKASIVERFNRTLMEKIFRFLTKNNTRTYVNALEDIIRAYNRTPHSATGHAPDDITSANREDVWLKLYNRPSDVTSVPEDNFLKIGDTVRIPKEKKYFTKGYAGRWKEEIFRIRKILTTRPKTYVLEDLGGELIQGSFYRKELQKTQLPTFYPIETVLDRKGKRYLVKWRGYPKKFNSWTDNLDSL